MYTDLRRMPRRQSALEATVKVPLRAPLPCFITDVSPMGGLLEVDRYEYVPARFKVEIGGFETECYVMHRNRRYIGVEFATMYEAAYEHHYDAVSAA